MKEIINDELKEISGGAAPNQYGRWRFPFHGQVLDEWTAAAVSIYCDENDIDITEKCDNVNNFTSKALQYVARKYHVFDVSKFRDNWRIRAARNDIEDTWPW